MPIRELRINPTVVLVALTNQALITELKLPPDAHVTDVALEHGHTATHRDRPPIIILQIESSEFRPEDAGRPLP
jgi:hypothetical protein